jgi:ABC-type transporter Mla subunit MlaD
MGRRRMSDYEKKLRRHVRVLERAAETLWRHRHEIPQLSDAQLRAARKTVGALLARANRMIATLEASLARREKDAAATRSSTRATRKTKRGGAPRRAPRRRAKR